MALSHAQQRAAVTTGHLVIPACPGSGKTTVLKHRVEFLLKSDPSARLAAVTYTNDAAESLAQRITEQYAPAARRLIAGTFHSLCKRQIEASSNAKVKLINDGQRARLIIEAMSSVVAKDLCLSYDSVVEQIDIWQRECDPLLPSADSDPSVLVFRRYEDLKRRHGVMDFSDLLRNALRGMRAGTVAPLPVQYMCVDEFQDTDQLQLDWVMAHVNAGAYATIVGDDDQSIYGWRGALGYSGLMAFKSATNAEQINLDRTYRCAAEILLPAGRLILHNHSRVSKDLITANLSPGATRVRTFETRDHEIERCIEAIADSGHPETWAVLARTNALLDVFECAIGQRFPYARSGGASFWDTKVPSMLVELAGSLANGNMLGLSRVLSECGVSRGLMDRLSENFAFDRPGAIDDFIRARIPRATAADKALVAKTQSLTKEWREMIRSGSAGEIALAIKGMAFYIEQYASQSMGRSPEDRQMSRRRLQSAAKHLSTLAGSLSRRIQMIRLQKKNDTSSSATLMTLHAAKGLEFDRVWILACEEGTLPSAKSDTDEERRLMYVGMTRAKTDLTLSYCLDAIPSKFLREAGLLGNDLFANRSGGVST